MTINTTDIRVAINFFEDDFKDKLVGYVEGRLANEHAIDQYGLEILHDLADLIEYQIRNNQ